MQHLEHVLVQVFHFFTVDIGGALQQKSGLGEIDLKEHELML